MFLKNTLEKVNSNDCFIEIFGLGYVGFPLSVRLAKSGFNVVGVDKDSEKIKNLKNKSLTSYQSRLKKQFLEALENGNLTFNESSMPSNQTKIGIISVPTPIPELNKDSNVFVKSALENFLSTSKSGDVVILESSIQIGTTENVAEIIESKGFKTGVNFGLCFCPERIDPLNHKWKLENIPRIIYSSDDISFQIAQKIYQHVNNSNLFRVSSPQIAEIVKSFENAFRLVNISLVNELAILCDKLGINVREVIDAASTKPFGFMPFYSSAGAGGHCIPKDPRFLLLSAKKMSVNFGSIEQALEINSMIPKYIVDSIEKTLSELQLEKSVIVSGLSYKPDVEDMRDSPGFKIIKELIQKRFKVAAFDPYFKIELMSQYLVENHLEELSFKTLKDLDLESIKGYNCICTVQNHTKTKFRINEIYKKSLVPMIYDCQNSITRVLDSKTLLKGFGF